jgi:hypothetical protein
MSGFTAPLDAAEASASAFSSGVQSDFDSVAGAVGEIEAVLGNMSSGLEDVGVIGSESFSQMAAAASEVAPAVQSAAEATEHAAAASHAGSEGMAGLGAGLLLAGGQASGFGAIVAASMIDPLLGAAEAAKEAADAIVDAFKEVGKEGADISLIAESAGTSVEFMSRMKAVAEDAGVGVDALGNGFRFLQRNAADAVQAATEALKEMATNGPNKSGVVKGMNDLGESTNPVLKSFNDLGISAEFLKSHLGDSEGLFVAIHEALQKLPDQASRTRAEMELLGRGGAELAPLFNLSAEQMKKFGDTAEDLGAVIDTESAQNGRAWIAMEAQFHQAWEGIERAATEPIFAWIGQHTDQLGDIMKDVSDIIRDSIPVALDVVKLAADALIPTLEGLVRVLHGVLEASDALGLTSGAGDASGKLVDQIDKVGTELLAGGGAGGNVTINKLQIDLDPNAATSQIADKLGPHLKRAVDQQTAEYHAAAHRAVVAKGLGGHSRH